MVSETICKYCGRASPSTARACVGCGAPLEITITETEPSKGCAETEPKATGAGELRPTILERLLGIGAAIMPLVAFLGVAFGQYSLVVWQNGTLAVWFYGLGVGAFLLALLSQRFVPPLQRKQIHQPPRRHLINRAALGTLAGTLMLVSLLTVGSPGASGISLVSWALSLSLALAVAIPRDVSLVELIGLRWARLKMRGSTSELIVAGVIVGVGAALRVYDLGNYPSGIHGDEAEFGLIAHTILQGRGPNPFGTAFLGDPAMFLYFEAPFLALFGQTITAVRLFSALSGVLTLPAFYLLMRRLFGTRPALLALALLSGSALHVNYSRMALNIPQVELLACLTFYALWRGQQTGRAFWWFVSGLLGGLAAYFYFAARILPVIMGLYLLYLLIARWRDLRAMLKGGALAFLGGALTLAPMGALLFTRSHEFTTHMTDRFIFTNWSYATRARESASLPVVLYEQFRVNLLAFISIPDGGFYSFAASPLLSPVLGALVVLGLALTLSRLRDSRYALLALWFWTVVIVNGVLTTDPPQSSRLLLAVFPAIAGISLVLEWAAATGERLLDPSLASTLVAVAVVVPIVAGYADIANYFGPAAEAKPWEATTAQGKYVAALGGGYRVFGAGTPNIYINHGVTKFMAPDVEGVNLHNPAASLPMAVPPDKDLAFLIYPHMNGYLPLLQSLYPNGQVEALPGRGGQPLFTAFRVSRSEVSRTQGLNARYGLVERLESDTSALGGGATSYPTDATWLGSIFIEQASRYHFQLEGAASELLLDGSSLGSTGERELSVGWHHIEIRGRLPGPESRAVLKWRGPNQALVPVAQRWLDARPIAGNLRAVATAESGQVGERRDRTIGFRNVYDIGNVRRPASFAWEGTLNVATSGRYGFSLNSTGEAEITVDGKSVAANRGESPGLRTATGTLELTAGPHPVSIRYVWRQELGIVEALWTPPGGQPSIIPPEALGPPQR